MLWQKEEKEEEVPDEEEENGEERARAEAQKRNKCAGAKFSTTNLSQML